MRASDGTVTFTATWAKLIEMPLAGVGGWLWPLLVASGAVALVAGGLLCLHLRTRRM